MLQVEDVKFLQYIQLQKLVMIVALRSYLKCLRKNKHYFSTIADTPRSKSVHTSTGHSYIQLLNDASMQPRATDSIGQ